jgi:hypothetical protein
VGRLDETVRGRAVKILIRFKLQNAGYGLGYNPEALIFHQYEPSISALLRTFFRYGYGCAGQSAKHYRPQEFVQGDSFGALDLHG